MGAEYLIEREDWTLFCHLETLSQKAGVPVEKLRRLALKELTDNALDAGGHVKVNETDDGYVIEDDGPGIDGAPETIARLFSVNRPMVSSKLWRRPQRGALGNGLRVVAGALIASGGGVLNIHTRNRRLSILPNRDGDASLVEVESVYHPIGTRIEISFGPHLPPDKFALYWARWAIMLASGEGARFYKGQPSVHWHDPDSFYTLIKGGGPRPVREFISTFDKCSGAKAGEIAASFLNRTCESLSFTEATELLQTARAATSNVSHKRLGAIGKIHELPPHYAYKDGHIKLGVHEPKANLPFAVEAWAKKIEGSSDIYVNVNGTPITGEAQVYHNSAKNFVIHGCNLGFALTNVPKKGNWRIHLNVVTPHMPIMSDGKTPDLKPFYLQICEAIALAIRKTKSGQSEDKKTLKSVYLDHLDEGVAKASGDGKYRFSLRQLFYALRPFIIEELEGEPTYEYFASVITDYEADNGEIKGMFRDDRGAIYHPHTGYGDVPLGTLMVENYERPSWTFNKLIAIEKQGFFQVLKDERFPERHDCMLATSKGFSSRAIRDLIDRLAEHDEPITVFCIHDADAAGTMIYQTLQEETRARGARKVTIVNLGLEPWEAEEMGLDFEKVEKGKKTRAVADYVKEYDSDNETDWAEWLQESRYEVNAMTTPQFLDWIERKMEEHREENGVDKKVIPPAAVIDMELKARMEANLRDQLTRKILREAKIDEQVQKAMDAIEAPEATTDKINEWFEDHEIKSWRDYLDEVVGDLTDTGEG
ncbi:hypothetical protein [Pseudorhodoplanes sp.]|uniref:hypothetical protein n=1 Tax=Pseudorhodoplanes sp. TaxID=1934341 RepID=UPI003D1117BD